MNGHTNAPQVAFSALDPSVFNLTEALDRVEGDFDLLKEMTDLFLETYPILLTEVEHAVAVGNAQALQHAAHTLKGSVSNFAAGRATEASFVLEKMGRQQNLSNAAMALATLKQELIRLYPALITLKEKEAA